MSTSIYNFTSTTLCTFSSLRWEMFRAGRRFVGKCIKIGEKRKTQYMQIKWFELGHWDAERIIN